LFSYLKKEVQFVQKSKLKLSIAQGQAKLATLQMQIKSPVMSLGRCWCFKRL